MAQKRMRERTWAPISCAQILALVSEKDSRVVRSEVHLLDLVIESLGRLERELHGELPAVRDLWDKGGDGAFRPRDEEDFCDYVTRFLKRDLQERRVVINREVQIRRRQGASPGERTDIRVDAFALAGAEDRGEPITVIVEAKGSWHEELETAMDSQLVGRYLKENACQTGLYLVGWFNCGQWTASDPRQHTAMRRVRADIEAKLEAQARNLSRGGVTVRSLVLTTGFRATEGA